MNMMNKSNINHCFLRAFKTMSILSEYQVSLLPLLQIMAVLWLLNVLV